MFSEKKKNVFGNKILKNSFCSKKKTCFVKLTKKFFRINKTKKMFESYFLKLIKCFFSINLIL